MRDGVCTIPGVATVVRAVSLAGAIVALSGGVAFAQSPINQCGEPGTASPTAPPCTHSWVTNSGFAVAASQVSTGASSATTTSQFNNTSASASANYNATRVTATTTASTGPRSESRFLDTFLVSGGSGTGTATFHWNVTGTLLQFTPPDPCDQFRDGVEFFADAVSRGLTFQFLPLCTADSRTINRSGTFSITFTYGVPFLEGLTLHGEAPNGRVDLAAVFTTIDLPPGAVLTSGSGTAYPVTPTSPTALLTSLLAVVANLPGNVANSFDAKLQTVLDALEAARSSDAISACNRMNAFVNEVAAQTGKSLTVAQAQQLTLLATNVSAALACQ